MTIVCFVWLFWFFFWYYQYLHVLHGLDRDAWILTSFSISAANPGLALTQTNLVLSKGRCYINTVNAASLPFSGLKNSHQSSQLEYAIYTTGYLNVLKWKGSLQMPLLTFYPGWDANTAVTDKDRHVNGYECLHKLCFFAVVEQILLLVPFKHLLLISV